MNAAIYARKSTDDERSAEDGKSIPRQIELSRAFAMRQGWTVGEVFSDGGISGGEFVDRPDFIRMIESVKSRTRPFGVVVMMALGRLGRNQVHVMNALTELHDAGVKVYCYQTGNEVKLDTPNEILIASVEAFADAAYRHTISLNVRESSREKARKGPQHGPAHVRVRLGEGRRALRAHHQRRAGRAGQAYLPDGGRRSRRQADRADSHGRWHFGSRVKGLEQENRQEHPPQPGSTSARLSTAGLGASTRAARLVCESRPWLMTRFE